MDKELIEWFENLITPPDWFMTSMYGAETEVSQEAPTGWLCPRCKTVNAPDVKRCDCEPHQDDMRRGVLPNTVAGPSEVK